MLQGPGLSTLSFSSPLINTCLLSPLLFSVPCHLLLRTCLSPCASGAWDNCFCAQLVSHSEKAHTFQNSLFGSYDSHSVSLRTVCASPIEGNPGLTRTAPSSDHLYVPYCMVAMCQRDGERGELSNEVLVHLEPEECPEICSYSLALQGWTWASKTLSWKSSRGWYKDGIFPQETRWPNCTAWDLLTLMSFTLTEALVLLDWRVTSHHFINTFFFRLLSKVSENVSSPNNKWAGKGLQPSHSWQGKNANWNSPLVDGFAAYLEKYEILEEETDLRLLRSLQKSARKRGRNGTGMLLNCGVGEDSRESLGLQGDQTSPS